jgi:hypothetical protein
LTNVVEDVLKSDDKLLSSLQKLGRELEMEDQEEADTVSQLRETCARLIKYNVECIRTQLDRSYLQNLQPPSGSGSERHTPKEDIAALQEELESLYSEILPVAQMSVEQQWLEPSLRSVSANASQGLSHASASIEYVGFSTPLLSGKLFQGQAVFLTNARQILDCLDHLRDRIERVSDRVITFKAHESATGAIAATARAELSTPVTSNTTKDYANVAPLSSPARRFQPADDMMTPVSRRGTANAKSRRRSSGGAPHESPLDHLLGELGISLPAEDKTQSDTTSARTQAALLSRALAERTQKAADVGDSVQSTFEHAATAHLSDARSALQLIRDSVLAESPYAEVHLVDPGIESSIRVLAQECQNIASRLEGVESEAAALARGPNVNRDEIVSRWGRRG